MFRDKNTWIYQKQKQKQNKTRAQYYYTTKGCEEIKMILHLNNRRQLPVKNRKVMKSSYNGRNWENGDGGKSMENFGIREKKEMCKEQCEKKMWVEY